MMEVETAHRLVREFGIEPHHVGPFQMPDECQRVADGGEQHVAARLVRFGLDRETHVVAAVTHERAAGVDGFLVTVERVGDRLCRIDLAPLATAPHHVHRGTELHAELDCFQRLRERVAAHGRVVGGERAFLEHGLREQVRGGHRHAQPCAVEHAAEALHDRLAVRRRRAERHEVVVVEVDPVGTEIRQRAHRLHRVERRPGLEAEGVTAAVADRPEPERETVVRRRNVGITHRCNVRAAARRLRSCRSTATPWS